MTDMDRPGKLVPLLTHLWHRQVTLLLATGFLSTRQSAPRDHPCASQWAAGIRSSPTPRCDTQARTDHTRRMLRRTRITRRRCRPRSVRWHPLDMLTRSPHTRHTQTLPAADDQVLLGVVPSAHPATSRCRPSTVVSISQTEFLTPSRCTFLSPTISDHNRRSRVQNFC